jgi:hypothetical protein
MIVAQLNETVNDETRCKLDMYVDSGQPPVGLLCTKSIAHGLTDAVGEPFIKIVGWM